MRFADVEHSGRADIIHLDKYTGAATQFKNLGHSPGGGGSSFSWANKGVRYLPTTTMAETAHVLDSLRRIRNARTAPKEGY